LAKSPLNPFGIDTVIVEDAPAASRITQGTIVPPTTPIDGSKYLMLVSATPWRLNLNQRSFKSVFPFPRVDPMHNTAGKSATFRTVNRKRIALALSHSRLNRSGSAVVWAAIVGTATKSVKVAQQHQRAIDQLDTKIRLGARLAMTPRPYSRFGRAVADMPQCGGYPPGEPAYHWAA
jgi:hypothetical protein